MTTYDFQTKEGCRIQVKVEGQHVMAGLDELLGCTRVDAHLEAPFLIDGLVVHLAKLKPMAIVAAADRAGCLPGMLLAAIYLISGRASYWHRKALAYDAAELAKRERYQHCTTKDQATPKEDDQAPAEVIAHKASVVEGSAIIEMKRGAAKKVARRRRSKAKN